MTGSPQFRRVLLVRCADVEQVIESWTEGGGQLFPCLPVRPFHQPFADHKPSLVVAAQARVLPHVMMRTNISRRVMNRQETT